VNSGHHEIAKCLVSVEDLSVRRMLKARYCFTCTISVCPSVRPFVLRVVVLYLNECTYCQTFLILGWGTILVFCEPPLENFKGNPSAGTLAAGGGGQNVQFSTKIAVCLTNDTRDAHDYCGSLMGSHGYSRSIHVGSDDLQ